MVIGAKFKKLAASVAIAGSLVTGALVAPGTANADEYGLTPDYSCTVSGTVKSATISHQSCVDAFLYEAHVDKLTSRWGDTQLVSDGVIACLHGSADIDVVAAAVRRMDSSLAGGKPVFGGNEDVPAVNLAWVAVGTLCTGGVT